MMHVSHLMYMCVYMYLLSYCMLAFTNAFVLLCPPNAEDVSLTHFLAVKQQCAECSAGPGRYSNASKI